MCINIYHKEYSAFSNKLSSQLQQELRPSIKMEKMLQAYFMSMHEETNTAMKKFTERYQDVVDYLNNTKSDLQNKSLGGGVIGGMLAGLAFGPIGAVVGGIAAGCFIEDNIKESARSNIEEIFQNLFAEFEKTLEQIIIFLEDVVINRLISATDTYKQCLIIQKPFF